jgi:hypothetical protein
MKIAQGIIIKLLNIGDPNPDGRRTVFVITNALRGRRGTCIVGFAMQIVSVSALLPFSSKPVSFDSNRL